MVSRIAKNLQDYFTSIVIQKLGAQLYSDGLKHSLELPFQTFEDQRSGETLGILQKVRTDSEKFITSFISVLFAALVGMIFVMIYSLSVSYKVTLVYFASVPVIALTSWLLSRKIKVVQKTIVKETTSLAGSTTESLRNIELVKSLGLANQEIALDFGEDITNGGSGLDGTTQFSSATAVSTMSLRAVSAVAVCAALRMARMRFWKPSIALMTEMKEIEKEVKSMDATLARYFPPLEPTPEARSCGPGCSAACSC